MICKTRVTGAWPNFFNLHQLYGLYLQTAGYIEKNTAPVCDSEQDCITDHNYRNIPELPELLEEFLPWIQEVQKECHSTRFMAKRSNEQPLPKMAQKQ